jgi:phosphopantetheinyl transferase (holo-ACP synthase)
MKRRRVEWRTPFVVSDEPVVGIDLVADSRVEELSDDALYDYFHPDERKSDKQTSIFALKEAARKAVDLQASWLDVHVSYNDGSPTVTIRGFEGELDCSVSHENGFTVAVVSGIRRS